MQLIPRRVRTGDHGAAAVLIAVVLTPILLAMGAILVDLGHLYADRRQQQNGADSAALAVAHDCARYATVLAASPTCDGPGRTAGSTATTYAQRDAYGSGYTSEVTGLCRSALSVATTLAVCPAVAVPGASPAWTCPAPSAEVLKQSYVQVETNTLTGSGSTLLPKYFVQLLAGNAADPGHSTQACARAQYGPAKAGEGFGFTISDCEWTAFAGSPVPPSTAPPGIVPFGTTYSRYPTPSPSRDKERLLLIHKSGGTTSTSGCTSGPSGFDMSGDFGWLAGTDSSCHVFISGPYGPQPGTSGACKDALNTLWNWGSSGEPSQPTVVYIPIYSASSGHGKGGSYTPEGFAAFVLTGYHDGGGAVEPSWITNTDECASAVDDAAGNSTFCLSGFFTAGILPVSTVIGGPTDPDYGVDAFKLIG